MIEIEKISVFKSERGGTLISTLLFALFLSLFISSAVLVLKHQALQFKQTAYAYEAKAMIQMTERLITVTESKGQPCPERVLFNQGKTTVAQLSKDRYQITAVLSNNYTSKKTVQLLPVPVEDSRQETSQLKEPEETGESMASDFSKDIDEHVNKGVKEEGMEDAKMEQDTIELDQADPRRHIIKSLEQKETHADNQPITAKEADGN
ncbi:hypothetical protein ADIAL_1795 [Alkalibacterium sp. AK22]|uniref:hypothetical protein n=1 Tax=Alkalibacterium sp. AK22 TaxID=1229520 RepID=UPI000448248B|nr:hypothetical protein [Alkalibacterium sp. AK22]EXJ22773.1 hypothetical protein ADIAL_1795 [Alkalibacterium sp. AK22]